MTDGAESLLRLKNLLPVVDFDKPCPHFNNSCHIGFVESTINQLVAKRFVKKQQMRWTPRGAHLLLQIRVQALNGDLHGVFDRWCPGLRRKDSQPLAAQHTPNFRVLS
jgi:hypothetical protein